MFYSISDLEKNQFVGFKFIADLQRTNCVNVSEKRGVYIVVRPLTTSPTFNEKSIGGFFKQKNPAVGIERLHKHWVDSSIIMYIGKSGSRTNKRSIKKRMIEFMNFGKGQPIGHWGGRFIWQLADSDKLQICWKPTLDEEPIDVERRLIKEFKEHYNKRPFANLRS